MRGWTGESAELGWSWNDAKNVMNATLRVKVKRRLLFKF